MSDPAIGESARPDPPSTIEVGDLSADPPSTIEVGDLSADPPSTIEVGDLSGPVGEVDDRGALRLHGAPWRVEWAVGTGDRWHVAAEAVAVRQHLLDDTPVTVTAMRVAGGDVIHRAAAVRDGTDRAVTVEIENQSGRAVSLAVAVRPVGPRSVGEAAVAGRTVVMDGRQALVIDRAPGGTVAASDDTAWSSVRAGPGRGDRAARSVTGTASAAILMPLGHGQSAWLVVPVTAPVEPVPPAAVAAGWRAIRDRAATVDGLDDRSQAAWRRGVPQLVLAAGSDDLGRAAVVAPLLDRLGLPDEADRARRALLGALADGALDGAVAVATARALASRRLRAGRDSGLAEWTAVLLDATRSVWGRRDRDLVADALELEDPRAAADVRSLDPGPDVPGPVGPALGCLVDALVSESAAGVDLMPEPAAGWIGRGLDVRGVLTRHGALSYSLRWHAGQPVILWEIEARGAPRVTCSGLDARWSTEAAAGEALLAAPSPG